MRLFVEESCSIRSILCPVVTLGDKIHCYFEETIMADNDKKLEDLFGTNADSPANRSISDADRQISPEEPAKEAEETEVTEETEVSEVAEEIAETVSEVISEEEQEEDTKGKKHKKPKKKKQTKQSEPKLSYDKRDYSPIRKSREMRVGCLGGLMYCAFVLSISVILACLAWMGASDVLALNKVSLETVVTLDDDLFTEETVEYTDDEGNVKTKVVTYADIDAVADILKEEGLIEYKPLFKFYCAISNASNKIAAGTYELSTGYDYRALVKKMNQYSGAAVTVKVTFPEGFNMKQTFELLEENKVASAEALMDAAKDFSFNYSFLNPDDVGNPNRLEGYLFPDTYEFFAYMEPSSAIVKFLDNYNRRVTDEMEAKAAEMGRSMDEIITIASLIEKEAANNDERDDIASVIYNRLAADMPLQLDASIVYFTGKERVDLADLEIDNPYNTYLNKGLPAGPICNPGLASIEAALNPANTKYYYYALDTATGTHRFFNDYNSHAAFVATQDYG